MSPKKISSPYASGGGGFPYEYSVCAVYLAAVLLRSVPQGQEAGTTREVRLQRLYDSEPLDDIIVISDLKCGEAKLALQVKRDLSFGEKDEKFDEVMEACWSTFKSSDFRIGIDRFGLVIALYTKNINEYYQTVLTWARNSIDSQDFLKRINTEGFSNKTQRTFVDLIKTKLNKHSKTLVTDNDLWNFLRSMVILHFDFQQEGSRDYTYAVETISHLLPPNQKTDAPKLFEKLVNYATNGSKTAGSFNLDRLTEKLLSDDFDILPSPDCRNDLARLEENADFILNNIQNTIGNFKLDRSNLISKMKKIRERASFIEIVGAPGVGKSAILKELIEDDRQQGFSLVLSGDRISGASWSSFASHLQIEQPVQKILLAASSVAQPTIFIDGIDKIIDSGHQNVINDLIRILQTIKLDWKIIVSMREENRMEVYQWFNWQPFEKPEQIHIPELTRNELRQTISNNNFLKPLLSLTHIEPMIKNLLILSLLKKQEMMFDLENLPPISTEIEFEKWWWQTIINDRWQSLIKLGKQAILSPNRRLLAEDISLERLESLESDRIISRDSNRDVYYFGHDLLKDWVLYRILKQNQEDLTSYLFEIRQPLGLYRSIRLLGIALLEENESPDLWIDLIRQVEQQTELSGRWEQALLAAPINSPRSIELLEKAKSFLLSENAKYLIKLMIVLRTIEVEPNFSYLNALEKTNYSSSELMNILLRDPIPRWKIWQPFMKWILPRLTTLPKNARTEAIRLMEMWQLKTSIGSIYRQEIAEIAFSWLQEKKGGF